MLLYQDSFWSLEPHPKLDPLLNCDILGVLQPCSYALRSPRVPQSPSNIEYSSSYRASECSYIRLLILLQSKGVPQTMSRRVLKYQEFSQIIQFHFPMSLIPVVCYFPCCVSEYEYLRVPRVPQGISFHDLMSSRIPESQNQDK